MRTLKYYLKKSRWKAETIGTCLSSSLTEYLLMELEDLALDFWSNQYYQFVDKVKSMSDNNTQ